MLELKNISKIIDDHVILNDISIAFPAHGFIGIKGRSGSGKSSLLYILSLLDEDFLGSLFFNGQNIENAYEYRKTAGATPNETISDRESIFFPIPV